MAAKYSRTIGLRINMSGYLHGWLNQINRPELSYLELGVGNKGLISTLNFKHKVGVDTQAFQGVDFVGTTDDFFAQNTDKFDIIFIDADHTFKQIIKDFNNAKKCLKPRATIFLHDLYPPDEGHCAPNSCGDGYKFLNKLIVDGMCVPVCPQDFGLTMVPYPEYCRIEELDSDVTYQEFVKNIQGFTCHSKFKYLLSPEEFFEQLKIRFNAY